MADRLFVDPEIIGPEDGRAERIRRRFWTTVRRAMAAIPFMDQVVAAYFCAFDPETPTRVRATLIAALAYFVMPFDVIPDFIAGLGFTDDLTVLATAIAVARAHIGERHLKAARAFLADPDARPKDGKA